MRNVALAAVLVALSSAPALARAGTLDFFVDASVGIPWQTSPDVYRQPTNVMVTPGLLVLNLVSAEVGVKAGFSQFDQPSRWGLRPMIGLYPPILPVYAKLVIEVDNLNDTGGLGTLTTVGGALGLLFTVGPVRLFLEADYIPQKVAGQNLNIWEGRLGAGLKI